MVSSIVHKSVRDKNILVLDSITQIDSSGTNKVLIAGSHGGLYCGWYAVKAHLRGVILHDAGVGLESAGIACLDLLQTVLMPAATVSYKSARIGDGQDIIRRGVISFCNLAATELGVQVGMSAYQAALCMAISNGAKKLLPMQNESRYVLSDDNGHGYKVIGLDSNSLVAESDAKNIVVTGSHGALLGGLQDRAIAWPVVAAVYNDAGIGIDNAGYTRLPALDSLKIPAMTVSHDTAKIGDARSSWNTGIVSCVNQLAEKINIRIGMTIPEAVSKII